MSAVSFFLVCTLVIYAAAQTTTDCPALYMRFSATHSYCKPSNPACNILRSSVSAEDIIDILRQHNNLRSKLATGGEQNLPTAANMLQMVWDDELAGVAQRHANQCLFEHDCATCRRVQNFGVGQNLAIETVSNSPNIPNPNWPSAIKSWYDEIAFFSSNAIDPFIAPPPEPTYGHFSQLFWGESWRIGCGYVLYQERNTYQKLYVCNYGPAGNTVGQSMYKVGPPCSACPKNSCCDRTCGATAEYPGLCKITDNRAPQYKPEGPYILYCDFNNQADCNSSVTGPNKWLIYNTLSGSYLGIVLNGGEETTMTFASKIKPSTSSFCFVVMFRKGPNVAGQEETNTATETFSGSGFEFQQSLPSFSGDTKQQFSQFSMSLAWNMETEFKITFVVPAGKPQQFLEIQSIYATEGPCNQ